MKHLLVSGLLGLALWLAPSQASATAITVDSATVNVSDIFNINLNIVNAVSLTSWQFDLDYDHTILQANVVTEGAFLSSSGANQTVFTPGVIDHATGYISLVSSLFSDFSSPPSGSGVLASIQFTALTPGLSPLLAQNVFLNGLDSGFTTSNGAVCVLGNSCTGTGGGGGGSVPLPDTAGLFLMGGLMLWAATRWLGQQTLTR
jgi:hypothetical protein